MGQFGGGLMKEAMLLDDRISDAGTPHIEVYWPPDHASGGFLAALEDG